MLSFWARYVLLKEKDGVDRETTLNAIEKKFGLEKRQEIEKELPEKEEGEIVEEIIATENNA